MDLFQQCRRSLYLLPPCTLFIVCSFIWSYSHPASSYFICQVWCTRPSISKSTAIISREPWTGSASSSHPPFCSKTPCSTRLTTCTRSSAGTAIQMLGSYCRQESLACSQPNAPTRCPRVLKPLLRLSGLLQSSPTGRLVPKINMECPLWNTYIQPSTSSSSLSHTLSHSWAAATSDPRCASSALEASRPSRQSPSSRDSESTISSGSTGSTGTPEVYCVPGAAILFEYSYPRSRIY